MTFSNWVFAKYTKCTFLSNILFNIIVYLFLFSAHCFNVSLIERQSKIKYTSTYYWVIRYNKLVVAVTVVVVLIKTCTYQYLLQISSSDYLLGNLAHVDDSVSLPLSLCLSSSWLMFWPMMATGYLMQYCLGPTHCAHRSSLLCVSSMSASYWATPHWLESSPTSSPSSHRSVH